MTMWQQLVEELDRWSGAELTATFWWRDDDAISPTPELELLLRHAPTTPVALAVIPSLATIELAERLRELPSVVVLQHGWAHVNHASLGKSEYPSSRSPDQVAAEVSAGRRMLLERFGRQALAVFAPPWHNFDDGFLPILRQHGITHISRRGPRPHLFAAPGVRQVNAHAPTVSWPTASVHDGERCVSSIIEHLQGRRTGRYDPREATGLLTHHLAQSAGSYEWIARLIDVTTSHRAAQWLAGIDVFQGTETTHP